MRPSAPLALCVCLAACSPFQVKTTRNPQADLSRYRTYAWASESSAPTRWATGSVLDETIKASVDQMLAKKGLSRADGSPPDLRVSYFAVDRNALTYGSGPQGTPLSKPGYEYIYRPGNLTLQFVDARTNRVLWEGTARDAVARPGHSQEQVASAVQLLLEKYPAV